MSKITKTFLLVTFMGTLLSACAGEKPIPYVAALSRLFLQMGSVSLEVLNKIGRQS